MKDQKTERHLTDNHYTFIFVAAFSLDDIDWLEADANPARLGKKLDDERAFGYSQDMEAGCDFPAIVLLDIGDGLKKLIMTGRHRGRAAQAALRTTLDAYVVRESDPARRELLLRSLNVIEGEAPSHNERMVHIAEMKRKYPDMSNASLATQFKVKKDRVDDYLKAVAVEQRADGLGCGAAIHSGKFSKAMKLALGSLHNDYAFIAATGLVARWPILRGSAGIDLITRLRSARTENAAMRMVEEADHEQIALEDDKKITKTPSSKATKLMGRFRGILKFSGGSIEHVHLAGIPAASRPGELRVATNLRNFINEVIDEIARLIAEDERTQEWRMGSKAGVGSSDRPSPVA